MSRYSSLEIRGVRDLFRAGMASGWQVNDAGQFTADQTLDCDVVIIGTGAGGGTAAEILTQAGLSVVLVEEGLLRTSNDFRVDEQTAYRDLYQEGAARMTSDAAIGILQGRSVGGTTTVNWTSSFPTPPQTLQQWRDAHGLPALTDAAMAPWFTRMQQRLHIEKWGGEPNPNNSVLSRGCDKLGYSWAAIPRNVNGCWDLGACGMGCPTNAKQSMLVTTLPAALTGGARLLWRLRAQRLLHDATRVQGVECQAMKPDGIELTGIRVTVRARHTLVACGGINSPALLLRSQLPDPHQRIGKRTFLHPVNSSIGLFKEEIQAFYGAPQSIYSDQFQWQDGIDGPLGFKLEVAPMQPGLMSAMLGGYGRQHREDMLQLKHMNAMIAITRDGFHDEAPGGTITLSDSGLPITDYPLNDYVYDGFRRAFLAMADIQFAAGATRVRPNHMDALYSSTMAQAKQQIEALDIVKIKTVISCAHVMGGCAMGGDEHTSVVDDSGRFRWLDDLSIMDGSVFPTSIGANPQLSIYGLACRNAELLAAELLKKA